MLALKRVWLVCLIPAVAAAQAPGHADPGLVLERVAEAMGVDKLPCVSIPDGVSAG